MTVRRRGTSPSGLAEWVRAQFPNDANLGAKLESGETSRRITLASAEFLGGVATLSAVLEPGVPTATSDGYYSTTHPSVEKKIDLGGVTIATSILPVPNSGKLSRQVRVIPSYVVRDLSESVASLSPPANWTGNDQVPLLNALRNGPSTVPEVSHLPSMLDGVAPELLAGLAQQEVLVLTDAAASHSDHLFVTRASMFAERASILARSLNALVAFPEESPHTLASHR